MKNLLLILSLFLSLTFSSCTGEHPLVGGGDNGISTGTVSPILMSFTVLGNDSSNQQDAVVELRVSVENTEGDKVTDATVQITKTISGESFKGSSDEKGNCLMPVNGAGVYWLSVLVEGTPFPISHLNNDKNNITIKIAQ